MLNIHNAPKNTLNFGTKYISKNANLGNILFQPPIKVPREAANVGAIKG